MATKSDFHMAVIGRAEVLHFRDFKIADVPAKVDTGAYRSAIHATEITEVDGKLSFKIFGDHPVAGAVATTIETDEYQKVFVANSFGHREERYEVKLRVKLGPRLVRASFTLADRSKKIYPVLIGRKLLNGRFLVDPNQTSLNRVELKDRYGIVMPSDEEDREAA